jgi:hypothetical protein
MPLNQALDSNNAEMTKRLKYTKDILTHMLNNNQQQNPVAVRGNPTSGDHSSTPSSAGMQLNSNSSRRAIGGGNVDPMNGFNMGAPIPNVSNAQSNPGLQTISSIQ